MFSNFSAHDLFKTESYRDHKVLFLFLLWVFFFKITFLPRIVIYMIGVEPDHYWPSFSRNGPDIKTDIFYQNYEKLHTFFLKYVYIFPFHCDLQGSIFFHISRNGPDIFYQNYEKTSFCFWNMYTFSYSKLRSKFSDGICHFYSNICTKILKIIHREKKQKIP